MDEFDDSYFNDLAFGDLWDTGDTSTQTAGSNWSSQDDAFLNDLAFGDITGSDAYSPWSAGASWDGGDPSWMTSGAASFDDALQNYLNTDFTRQLGDRYGVPMGDYSWDNPNLNVTGAWENWGNPDASDAAYGPWEPQTALQDVQALQAADPRGILANSLYGSPSRSSANRSTLVAPAPTGTRTSGATFPDGTPVPALKSNQQMAQNYQFKVPSDTGGSSRTNSGQVGNVGAPYQPRSTTNNGDLAKMIQGYNQAVQNARNAAEKDRNKALGAVQQWKSLIQERLAKNPFGAEYKAQTLGVVRDARARQYSAAVEELRQAYAQQGKPLDPRLLTMLRMQMSREENGDLRNLSVDTAGKAFAADQTYVNEIGQTVSALDRILSNTQRQPNPQELAFLMSLSRNGGN